MADVRGAPAGLVQALPDGAADGSAGPTAGDARRAADALVAQGAERVLLFGSVARGCQGGLSDIDLVAVLPDLDYRTRDGIHRRLCAAASEAADTAVDVIVTDRAEWRIQTEEVSGSFANAICADLVVLADHTPPPDELAETCWDKEQTMPTSNEALAAERLENAVGSLVGLRRKLRPDELELAAADAGDPEEHAMYRERRLIECCANAHMAIENALKAVGTLVEVEPRTLWAHDVERLADALSEAAPEDGPAMRALLTSAPDLVKAPGYITMWRTVGVYGTVGDGATAAEVASPQFTAALALIAADMAESAAEWLNARGIRSVATDRIARHAQAVRDTTAHTDLGTGAPLKPS